MIAPKCGGIPEIVESGVDGIFMMGMNMLPEAMPLLCKENGPKPTYFKQRYETTIPVDLQQLHFAEQGVNRKILLVCHGYPLENIGGVGQVIEQLTTYLPTLDWDVHVLAQKKWLRHSTLSLQKPWGRYIVYIDLCTDGLNLGLITMPTINW